MQYSLDASTHLIGVIVIAMTIRKVFDYPWLYLFAVLYLVCDFLHHQLHVWKGDTRLSALIRDGSVFPFAALLIVGIYQMCRDTIDTAATVRQVVCIVASMCLLKSVHDDFGTRSRAHYEVHILLYLLMLMIVSQVPK